MYFISDTFDDFEFEDEEFEEKFNPWDVKNVEEFRLYCCPECSTRNVHKSDFIRHALTFHPRSQIIFDKFEDNKEDVKPIVTEVTTSETIDTNVSNQPTSVSNNSATESRNVTKDDVTLETEKKSIMTQTSCYTSDESSDDEDTSNKTQVMQPRKKLQQNISKAKSANNNSSNLSNNKDLQENVPQSQNAFDYSILSTSEVQIQKLQESSINVPTNLSNNNVQESMPKKRHKLWNQKPMSQTPSLMINETPERTEEVSKQAKKTFQVSSTSRSIVIHLDNPQIDKKSPSSTNSQMSTTRGRRPYSFIEDQKIVKWIAKTDNYSKVNGIAMWKLMEKCNVLKDRSYQSMKERFRKVIIGKIDTYDLREDELADFKIFNEYAKERHLKRLQK